MNGLYKIQNGESRFIDLSGFHPKMKFVVGANPQEIREAYDFGMLGKIYLSAPHFNELSRLPKWIKNGVQDNFENNPTLTINDTLRINYFSAGPDFDKDHKYPAFNLMILGRSIKDQITVFGKRKAYPTIEDKDVHQKRALELSSIKIRMENAHKRPYWTYSSGKMYSSLLITQLTKTTPPAAERYLSSNIKMINENLLPSANDTHKRLCQRLH